MQHEHLQSSRKHSSELLQGLDPGSKADPRLKRFKVLCYAVVACLVLIRCQAADPLDQWTWRNPLPTGNVLWAVTYGNSQFVAVGGYGTILTSPDGITWSSRASGTTNSFYGIVFGNSQFVAVGGSGTILTSSDGVTWTGRTSPSAGNLYGITYGNNRFVAVGNSGAIVSSPDAISWSLCTSGTAEALAGITYGNNTFVVVGEYANLISSNGVTWTNYATSELRSGSVAFGNGVFVAVGSSGIGWIDYGIVYTSRDGISWQTQTVANDWLYGLTYGNNRFVAVGERGAIAISADGYNWSITKSGSEAWFIGIGCGGGQFVAVGRGGTIETSPDGYNWTIRAPNAVSVNDLGTVAYGNGRFLVATEFGSSSILVSFDGVNWAKGNLGTNCLISGISYASNQFLGVVNRTNVAASIDGYNWAILSSGVSRYSVRSIAYGNGRFLAIGLDSEFGPPVLLSSSDGSVWTKKQAVFGEYASISTVVNQRNAFIALGQAPFTSSDGVAWTPVPLLSRLCAVAYGNKTIVAVGWSGSIISSPDGVSWRICNSGTTNDLSSIAYGNNQFVAVGGYRGLWSNSGTIATSVDGVNWTIRDSGTANYLSAVAYGNGQFVAVGGYNGEYGSSGTIIASQDGVNWKICNAGSIKYLSAIVYGGNFFVAVGNKGTVLTSSDASAWMNRTSGTSANLYAVAFGNNRFVALGEGQDVLRQGVSAISSPDGTNWTGGSLSASTYLPRAISYGNSQFVAVGDHGKTITSTDGATWTDRDSGTSRELRAIVQAGNQFIAVGDVVLTSADGINWEYRLGGSVAGLTGIAYGSNQFVAVGGAGSVMTSPDLINWTIHGLGFPIALSGIAYGNNQFVAVSQSNKAGQGSSGCVLTSTDGTNWSYRFGTDEQLNEVAYGNGAFVVVGDGGTILRSESFTPIQPLLGPVRRRSEGQVIISLTGRVGTSYAVEGSTNLLDWTVLNNVVSTNATMQFIDAGAANLDRRFYRARIP